MDAAISELGLDVGMQLLQISEATAVVVAVTPEVFFEEPISLSNFTI